VSPLRRRWHEFDYHCDRALLRSRLTVADSGRPSIVSSAASFDRWMANSAGHMLRLKAVKTGRSVQSYSARPAASSDRWMANSAGQMLRLTVAKTGRSVQSYFAKAATIDRWLMMNSGRSGHFLIANFLIANSVARWRT